MSTTEQKCLFLILGIVMLSLQSCFKEPLSNNSKPTGSSNLKDTTVLNVVYGTNSAQVYDAYLPAQRDSNTPVIIMIHGGAWKAGQKEDMNVFMNIIKNQWKDAAVVNMNYRLASNTKNIHHTEIIEDISAVVSQLDSLKESYHISAKMGIMGASAGGQLAMIYAYRYDSLNRIKCVGNFYGPSIINDWDWYNSFNLWLGGKVGDILAEYVGQTWDTTEYKTVSPYWNISSSSQPTIIFHGNADPIVPHYQSQWLNSKLKSLGVAVEYKEYPAFHGFDGNQNNDAIIRLINFFKPRLQ